MRSNNNHKRISNDYNRADNRNIRIRNGGMGLNKEHKKERKIRVVWK